MNQSTRRVLVAGLFAFGGVWILLMGLIALVFGGGKVAASTAPDDGSIKAKVANIDRAKDFQINVAVKVTDKAGKILEGMTAQDVEAFEDGIPVHVENFAPAGQGALRLLLLIDCSPSMKNQEKLNQAKVAAEALTMLLREKSDYFGLYLFNDQYGQVKQGERIPVEPLTRPNLRKIWREIDQAHTSEGSPITATIDKAIDTLAPVPGRRVMIVLTDGTESDDDKDVVKKRAEEIANKAKEAKVPLYMINLPAGVDSRRDSDKQMMEDMANISGGQYQDADPTQLKKILEDIGKSLQDECTFTYKSPDPVENGRTRKLTVCIRNGAVGTKAVGDYNVPGVLSTSGGSGGSSGGPSIIPIFLVLGAVLVGLMFVPQVVRFGPPPSVEEETAPAPAALAGKSAPVIGAIKPAKSSPVIPPTGKSSQGIVPNPPAKGPRR